MLMVNVGGVSGVRPWVRGQEADLYDLQRVLNKSSPRLGDKQQQEVTRWVGRCNLTPSNPR